MSRPDCDAPPLTLIASAQPGPVRHHAHGIRRRRRRAAGPAPARRRSRGAAVCHTAARRGWACRLAPVLSRSTAAAGPAGAPPACKTRVQKPKGLNNAPRENGLKRRVSKLIIFGPAPPCETSLDQGPALSTVKTPRPLVPSSSVSCPLRPVPLSFLALFAFLPLYSGFRPGPSPTNCLGRAGLRQRPPHPNWSWAPRCPSPRPGPPPPARRRRRGVTVCHSEPAEGVATRRAARRRR